MENNNALAELAEQLVHVNNLIAIKIGYFSPVVSKAQRIVAELAKVDELWNKSNKTDADLAMYNTMLAMLPINCRAIAEEG